MLAAAQQDLRIGHVVSVQVLKREVRIAPETDVPGRFERLTTARFVDRHGARHVWPIRGYRPAGRNVVLTLDGPDDAQVAALRKATVVVPASERGALPEGAFFHDDVLGATVLDPAGHVLGEVTGVLDTPAYSLLEVRGADGREYLIACVPEHVRELDTDAGRVVVDPAFLLDSDGHAY